MINKMISTTGPGTSSLYIDKDDDNYGIGEGLTFNASAEDNIAIGANALNSTTAAALGNVGIGTDALTAVDDGDYNTAIGSGALNSLTGGSSNIAIGYLTMHSATGDASQNIALGSYAMDGGGDAWTTAAVAGCVSIGYQSMRGNLTTGANYTIAIGGSALAALTSGAKNTAIGYQAGKLITTGQYNTALGYDALTAQVTGDNNVAIGKNAFASLANADGAGNNVAIGVDAGEWATTAENSTFVGSGAGQGITGVKLTGNDNTAIGKDAGLLLQGAANANTLIGKNAGVALTTGDYNNALGVNAAAGVNTGSSNICIGYYAGDTITTGSNNIIIGESSDAIGSGATSQTVIGANITAAQDNETIIGNSGVFRFVSKQYVCDIADGEDAKSASTDATPIKLPAYSIIKSISVVVEALSNLGTYDVALYHSTDAGAVADDTALGGTPVEVLGAGIAATLSGSSASAVDIQLGTSAGIVKRAYYMDEGINVGAADRYIHVSNAGTSNGDTDPSTDGEINVLVEYIAID